MTVHQAKHEGERGNPSRHSSRGFPFVFPPFSAFVIRLIDLLDIAARPSDTDATAIFPCEAPTAMKRATIAVWFLGLCVTPVFADEVISAKTLTATKLATVFIKTEAKGITVSGSGFVVQKDGDSALVVTNLHVIAPKLQIDIEPDKAPPPPPRVVGKLKPRVIPRFTTRPAPRTVILTLKDATVTAVFGSGTREERSAKTEVVAVDPDNDLAILKVADVKDVPTPIVFDKASELIETATVYSLGYPFGSLLSTSKGSPGITVGKAAISSLRTNDDGELAIVQIDGALNPGNSGGPIVDPNGQLVGVAVATIKNSSGIGLAIPAETLRRDFEGRIGTIHAAASGEKGVDVEVGLIDPLGKMKSARLHYVRSSQVKGEWKKLKALEEVTGLAKVPLTIDKQLATGKFDLARPDANAELLLQVAYATGSGKELRSKIVLVTLAATAAADVPPPTPTNPSTPPTVPPRQPEVAGVPIVVRPWGNYAGKIGQPAKETIAKITDSNTSHSTGKIHLGKIYLDGDTDVAGQSFPIERQRVPDNAALIGVEVGYTNACAGILPIYRTPKGEVRGPAFGTYFQKKTAVKAKAGYAVGGILARYGLWLDGFCLVCMKSKPDGSLDVNDLYCSDWCGNYSGGAMLLGGTGAPIVGLIAGFDGAHNVNGIGLTFRPLAEGESAPNPVPQLPQRRRPTRAAGGATFPSPEVLANEEASNPARSSNPFVPWPIFNNGDTELFGNRSGPVRYLAPEGGLLIGFEFGTARNSPNVASATPIYRTMKGEEKGQPHGKVFERKLTAKAEAGYAVGGLVARDIGLYLIFMKVKADGSLDINDTRRSEWIGGHRGGSAPIVVGATGAPVIGFQATGQPNDRLAGMGLLLKRN